MSITFDNSITPQNMQFIAYIAGVEVPCKSVTISFGQFKFTEMSLEVPADPILHRLGADDRLPVAVFYLDNHAYDKPTFCLMAEGELVSWSYNRTAGSRTISFSVIDNLAVLTQLFIHFILDIESSLNANRKISVTNAKGNTTTVNVLPIAFFYQFLNERGDQRAINRPIDIFLNVLGSIAGYSRAAATPIYSKKKELLRAVTNAQQATLKPQSITGKDVYLTALNVVDKGKSNPIQKKEGPREFSKAGLVRYATAQNNLTLPDQNEGSAQELYNLCRAQGTLGNARTLSGIPGALLFESAVDSAETITSVGIVAPGRKLIEVIDSQRTTAGDNGFRKIHDYTANNHELSRGNPGKFTQAETGSAVTTTANPVAVRSGRSPGNLNIDLLYPVRGGWQIGVAYGYTRLPSNRSRFRFHRGIDIHARLGTPLRACADGIVVESRDTRGAYGLRVIVQHPATPTTPEFFTVYAHNTQNLVSVGDRVKRGQSLCLIGKTGNAAGLHIHFELRVGGNFRRFAIDPVPYFTGGPSPIYWEKAILREDTKKPLPYDTKTKGQAKFAQKIQRDNSNTRIVSGATPGRRSGISVGLLQLNQKHGDLYELCKEMRRKNQSKFDSLMGGPEGLGMFTGTKGGFKKHNFVAPSNVLAYWKARFEQTFSDPEFIQVQYEFARSAYFNPVLVAAQQLGVDNEKGVALLFDATVQYGLKNARNELVKAKAALGTNPKQDKLLARFAHLSDRRGVAAGASYGRRERILKEESFKTSTAISDNPLPVTIQPGVRLLDQVTGFRKPVGYALIPGVNYTSQLPAGTNVPNAKQAKADGGSRLSDLERQRQAGIQQTARQLFPAAKSFSVSQIAAATQAWERANGATYKKRRASALRTAKTQKTRTARPLERARVAIQFFMRWLQKTQLREHVVASPFLEDLFDSNGQSNGIFPVLGAMKNENVAIALAKYNQQGGSRSGSMWDFLRQTFQICLWDLGFITAPPALQIDKNHVIQGLTGQPTAAGVKSVNAIASYVSKPQNFFGLPPSCNVYFPSMIKSMGFNENYATQPTRTYLDDSTPAKVIGLPQKSKFAYLVSAKAGYPAVVDNALFDEKRNKRNKTDVIVYPQELYKGPVVNRRNTPTWFYFIYKELGNRPDRNQNPTTQTAANTNVIQPKIVGDKAVYKRGGQSFTVPYADDSKVVSRSSIFSQVGYFRGRPIRFNAVNIDGQILHQKAGSAFSKLRAAAKQQGISLVVKTGYKTAGEMAALPAGDLSKPGNKLGFSLAQSGAQFELAVLTKDRARVTTFLQGNAAKFGLDLLASSVGNSLTLKSREAVSDLTKGAANANGKKPSTTRSPRFAQNTLPPAIFEIIRRKGAAKKSVKQLTTQHSVYFNYARYEHFRETYASRSATISGVFNPYVVAGFPIFAFDEDRTNFLLAGLVTSGTHTLSNAGQASTTLQITNVRTFQEMFELLNLERTGLPVAPEDPIIEVRDRLQKFDEARAYYKRLFYGNLNYRGKDPLGDYQKLLGYANNNAEPEQIQADTTKDNYNLNSQFNRELQSLPAARKLFEDTNAALRYCARPVCTIEQYIDFYKNGTRRRTIQPGDGINHNYNLDLPFYAQIRDFTYTPALTEDNDPTDESLSKSEQYARLAKLPPTLRDWVSSLIIYRQKVYANQTGT